MEIEKKSLLMIILIFFSSCSFIDSESKNRILLQNFLANKKEKEIKLFTSDMLKHFDYPIIEVRTNGSLIQALMLPLATKTENRYYFSGTGQSLILNNGIVITTNGMDIDLLSVDYRPKNPFDDSDTTIELAKKYFTKEYQFVTPLFNTRKYVYNCELNIIKRDEIKILELVYETTFLEERCQSLNDSDQLNLINKYWVNNKNKIIKSIQSIPQKNIIIEIFQLKA